MEFVEFKQLFQENFKKLIKNKSTLYEVELDKDELWNLYLDSFPAGTNEIYRERREYDCSCCRQFIRAIGNLVVIDNMKVKSIWGFKTGDTTFQPVIDALDKFVLSKAITNIYLYESKNVGTDKNFEQNEDGNVITWDHFYVELPNQFVQRSYNIPSIKGSRRDERNVFKRSLDEISIEAVETVLDLINSNTLYRGTEWKSTLESFVNYKNLYAPLNEKQKELFAWEKAPEAGFNVTKIRNHSIGTLLVDISSGEDLEVAVKRYETIVAPANYKRPKAIFTQKMIEAARKTIQELGYLNSLERRYATLDDISVNNILFCNRDASKRVKGAENVFDELISSTSKPMKKMKDVSEISIDEFISEVLPTASDVQLYLENKHSGNFVSLIAPKNPEAPSMFKWNNAFGWAYAGNITDSMKDIVKSYGGKIDGDLRFTIQWNESGFDNSDLDAHCTEATGTELYFGHGRAPDRTSTKGQLDVDIIQPGGKIAVENITWASRKTMKDGVYLFRAHQYSGSLNHGFRAEIEFDGQIYSFDYAGKTSAGKYYAIAEVTLKNGQFSIKELLPSSVSSKDIWNLKTNNFVPVSTIMYSPNYWDEQNGIGNKHYFFMLKDCQNPETPNGFYNEFLKNELIQHKRVFEALGGKMSVENVDDQLSGLGFSSTMRNEVIVKVNDEKLLKVKI